MIACGKAGRETRPFAVPCVRLADKRLRCTQTAAHTAPVLDSATGGAQARGPYEMVIGAVYVIARSGATWGAMRALPAADTAS